ncbi:MAG TPA: DinB family protein [Patescibacteria group bacterium]|nr:DinB family protein [Patescibacteria group bacterium]
MKKSIFGLAIALAFAFAPLAVRAQQNPVTSAVRASVNHHAKILLAGAEEMPASKYNYAPTPQQMTFGRMVLHLAQSNGFFCSRISGEKMPMIGHLTEHSPKNELIAAAKSSFNFCDQALAKVNDSDLTAQVQMFGGHMMSKVAAMIIFSNDLADHYAQEAIYLRLNGHLPPTGEGPIMGHEMMKHGHGKM